MNSLMIFMTYTFPCGTVVGFSADGTYHFMTDVSHLSAPAMLKMIIAVKKFRGDL